MPGPVFLDGEDVTLRVPEQEDAEFIQRNQNDPRVRAGRTVALPTGRGDVEQFLGGTMGRRDDTIGLLVCDDGRPVGYVLLNRERMGDDVYRRGELAYWIDPAEQGNGYATAGSHLLLDHTFTDLGLHKVIAHAFESNPGSQRVLEKLGFTQEGRFRDEVLVDGDWEDYLRFGLLREEWTGDA